MGWFCRAKAMAQSSGVPCILSKCPFMCSEPGVFPGWGAELVLWAGSAGREQRGVASPCGGDAGWPWGGKVTGHHKRPSSRGGQTLFPRPQLLSRSNLAGNTPS